MKIFFEGDSIAVNKMSGIGHSTLEMIKIFDNKLDFSKDTLTIVVPFGKKKYLTPYGFLNAKIRTLPPGYKYVNYLLVRTSTHIPVDLYFGRGIYVFPNYKNWYVPFSKSLTFFHDVAFRLFPDTTHPKNLVYLRANFNRWLKRTDSVITISKESAKELESFYPTVRDKVKVIHLGINPSEYYQRPQTEIDIAVLKYGLFERYFMMVGNIEPRKNILNTLKAFRVYVDATKSDVQLVLIGGDGWKNIEIINYIEMLVNEGYKVYRPQKYVEDGDLPALYSGAEAVLHTAIHEGFGLPPLQAQACNTPLVVSNLPVLKEVLGGAKVTYVDPDSITSIAKGMEDAPKDKPINNPPTVFTWDNTVSQLIDLATTTKER